MTTELTPLVLTAFSGGVVALLLTLFGGGGSVLAVPCCSISSASKTRMSPSASRRRASR